MAMAMLAAPQMTMAQTPQPHEMQRVEKVRGAVVFYEFDESGNQFRRMPVQPTGVAVQGALVSETSGKGYVLLETAQGRFWVDKLNVKLSAAPLQARCSYVSRRSDTTTAGVRGSNEGCK